MKTAQVLGVAILLCAAYLAGRGSNAPALSKAGVRGVLYYIDPMHPSYRSDRPGKAPDCGMDLEPVYAGSEPPSPMSPGSVRLTPQQEHLGRLQTETVAAGSTARTLRTAGRVAADEGRTYGVSAGADGLVRQVFSDSTGSHVKRGQALVAFYSKDLAAPQQAYLYALESLDRLKQLSSASAEQLAAVTQQAASARESLEFAGLGSNQLDELRRTRREIVEIHLSAPVAGQILERRVAVGQRFMKGEMLYSIADLDRVWVLADVPRGSGVQPSKARIILPDRPAIDAQVAAAPLQFDEEGRTGKLRLEVANPHGALVPGMVVSVDLDAPAQPALTIDADAVIDSGTKKRTFVALGNGQYELRDLETGWQNNGRIEVRSGLKPGDRVVTTGAFLLDSESRMKSPSQEVIDSECGMKIASSSARRMEWKGATYHFCSESCERKFAARHKDD